MLRLNIWLGHEFSSNDISKMEYSLFHHEAYLDLKEIALEAGFRLYRFNSNHYNFSAILQDLTDDSFVYIAIFDVRDYGDKWYHQVLYRTMNDERDYTGGHNNFCEWYELPTALRRLKRRSNG